MTITCVGPSLHVEVFPQKGTLEIPVKIPVKASLTWAKCNFFLNLC